MSACRANSLSADAVAWVWMSKWRKVGSANACAPSMVRATQRIRTASCRRIEPPPRTPFAPFLNGRRVKAFVMKDAWRKKNRYCVYGELRCRSAPGVDEHHSVAGVADGYGQRSLQRVKELLHVAGAEAAAHPQSGNIRIADDDARIGVAFDLGDGVRQPLAVENDRAFAPCEFGGQLLRGDGDDGVVEAGGGQAFPRIERPDGGRGGGVRVRILRRRQRRLHLDA